MKTKFSGFLTLLLAFLVQFTFAQEKTVSGTVSDESGPLPGVSVIVKGTTTGTETDFDGKYSITVNSGDILQFSFVGMATQEIVIGSSNVYDVTMKADNVLEEVVVTALGIKREKQSLGYAQQPVKGEDLVRARQTDIGNAIAGKVSGVQFNGAPSTGFGNSTIRLRGNTDILYIVDNIKVNASSDINVDDIEEMSVLKGAAATALYGPEGVNGVIIITTKTAKDGQSSITVDHSSAIENLYLIPKYQNRYGGGYSQNFDIFEYDPAQHPAEWAAFDGQSMIEYGADESWGPPLDGQLVRHWDSWIEGDPEFGQLRPFSPNPDNVKNFFDTGVTNNTSVNFAKGGDGYSVRASIANIDRTGIMPNSKRRQVQGMINASLDLTNKLKAFAIVNYQDRRTKNNPDNGYGNIGANFNQWWQRQLDIDRLRNYRRNGKIVSWNIQGPTNPLPAYWNSPFFEPYENLQFQRKNAIYGKLGLNYEFTDNLSASVELRKSFNDYEYNDRLAWNSLGGQDLPDYTEDNSSDSVDEFFGIINYEADLTKDIDIAASVGSELSAYNYKRLYGSAVGGLTTENFYSLNTSVDRTDTFSTTRRSKRQSIFAKASIGYKSTLFLDGSYRLDWSSTANPEDNRVETYGASLSFIFSKLFSQNDILSFGKLRASIAQAPKFPGIYDTSETFSVGTPYGSDGTLSVRGRYPNPLLVGGVREEMEFGTELKFLKNRIGLDLTYFKKIDNEIPVQVSLDGSTGYTEVVSNEGKQTYDGLEIALNLVPFKTDNFEWDLTFNFATLERFVNKVSNSVTTNVIGTTWRGMQLRETAGEEWGTIYGRKFKRDENGNILLSSTGSPQFDTNQYLGNILPDFTGGLTNYIRYKNFNLGLEFDFQSGGKLFSATEMFNRTSGLSVETVTNNNLGNPQRDPLVGGSSQLAIPANTAAANSGGVFIEGVDMNSGAPVSYYVNASSYWGRLFALHERWMYDATYIKLRTIRLDYTLPKAIVDKTPFTDLNIGIFANNVWLIYSDVPYIDPSEIEPYQDQTYGWTEDGQLPSTRTIGLNVRLTF
ncbi:MAG: SusC/RagA family TonB-linked outer membrane protein [Flavobacteriaceae bacterium]|nr:SusC/RagA family TonB-linked outer membrane protein [Flavobacteriaceae bacterium]MCB0742700.1 SusC/RagA family TonB-linked outer membrane protein [Ignavibacteriota bacterium]